jgi:hypothetical protein
MMLERMSEELLLLSWMVDIVMLMLMLKEEGKDSGRISVLRGVKVEETKRGSLNARRQGEHGQKEVPIAYEERTMASTCFSPISRPRVILGLRENIRNCLPR